jgi:hypothetical protein
LPEYYVAGWNMQIAMKSANQSCWSKYWKEVEVEQFAGCSAAPIFRHWALSKNVEVEQIVGCKAAPILQSTIYVELCSTVGETRSQNHKHQGKRRA